MLVTVKRNEDGTVDDIHIYPESLAEIRELGILVTQRVNLKSGVLFLIKESELHDIKVDKLDKVHSPDTLNEVYRHT